MKTFYDTFFLIAITIFSICIALLVAIALAHGADCLTKSEARKHWTTQHLYWHTENHCWDATRGHSGRYQQARALVPVHPPAPEPLRKYLYPLDPNGSVNPIFEDYCCWPDISTIKNLANGVEK